MRAHEPAQTLEIGRPQLYVVRPPQPRTLTVAVLRWPLDAPTLRPGLHLDEMLWRPRQRLPDWLRGYLLVELPLPTSAIPTVPSPFRNGLATIPSCLTVQGVLAGVHNAHPRLRGWEHSDVGRLIFSHRKPGGTITTSVQRLQCSDVSDRTLATLWSVVRDLTDLDGDVLLAALAHVLDATDADGTTWITADAILDDRGIRPKTERTGTLRYRAGHRREDRARVAASMDRLEHLWVHLQDVVWLERRDGRRPRRSHLTHESRLLVIADRLVQDGIPVAWRYSPGTWLTPFLSRPNRQTALLAQQVLRYDPYRERWEKRLARYLTFHLRMDARRAAPLVRRIGPLLAELNLPVDRRHPERTRVRFETALSRLVEDGVIGAWEYTAEAQAVLASLPARRWVEQWQALTVVVRPSPPIAAHYAAIAVAPRVPRA